MGWLAGSMVMGFYYIEMRVLELLISYTSSECIKRIP